MKRNKEIEENIQTTLEEIRKYIAPVFHCKKMIAIGDQGLHQELSCAMDAGSSIEEAIECEAVKNECCHVVVYQHGEDKRFSYADKGGATGVDGESVKIKFLHRKLFECYN